MREKELLLYTDLAQGEILEKMAWLMENFENKEIPQEEKRNKLYQAVNQLVALSGNHGFYGNLWHCYLTYLLANSENVYSMPCEIKGSMEGSMNIAALHDFEIFREFFSFDFDFMFHQLDADSLRFVFDFEKDGIKSKIYNSRIRDCICQQAGKMAEITSAEEMKDSMSEFYRMYGVGKLGLHKAFRISGQEGQAELQPILNVSHVYLNDLVGYEIPKQKLIANTEAFVEGRKANNCLLFGDAGTGKSSSIKGILNEYYDQGLRIIEVYKHQFGLLNEVIEQIKDRHYRFIIYMDDLSFEDFEIEYKYLKAVIEGGLESKPENVLIYATSNRRHLIREKYSDKEERRDDLHSSDTVQEKLSLVNRFGVSIFFCAPDRKEFQNIVKQLAERYHVEMSEEELLAEANKWELAHSGLSGRTAQQFIDYLLGKKEMTANK